MEDTMFRRNSTTLTITLLELVTELAEAGGSDREVVAAVLDLIETGRVRLIGQVCEADLGAPA
jgi:hypothetical protein